MLGGAHLLNNTYNGSVAQLLTSIYPNYNWIPWLFGRTAKHIWDDIDNQRKFMDYASKQLNLNKMEDWKKVKYNVSVMQT